MNFPFLLFVEREHLLNLQCIHIEVLEKNRYSKLFYVNSPLKDHSLAKLENT